jgi:hypothetical protein
MEEYLKAKQEYEEYIKNEVDKPYRGYMTKYLKDNVEEHSRKIVSEGCLKLYLVWDVFGQVKLGEGNNCFLQGIQTNRICIPCKNYDPDVISSLIKTRRRIVCLNVCTEHFKGLKVTLNVNEEYIYITEE